MVDMQPLRGLRYAREAVDDLAQVVAPPYDVISKEEQAYYYARSTYNIIRLELGEDYSDDTVHNNRYTRAAGTLAEWRRQGILRQDTLPCYYLYQQKFKQDGHIYTRTSLLARIRLAPWSEKVVLPHEHTMSKPLDDRLNLLRATATNISPIMCLYDDEPGYIRSLVAPLAKQPEICITDTAGEEHALTPIADPALLTAIQTFFAERQLYVADGHHRYETALNYQAEIQEQRKDVDPNDAVHFVMVAVTDMDDPGLVVHPTHRLLFNLDQQALRRLTTQHLARYFTVTETERPQQGARLLSLLAQASNQSPSLLVSTNTHTWVLSINEDGHTRMAQSGHAHAWNQLDVAQAQTLIIEELLGLKAKDMVAGTHLRYTRDPEQVLQALATAEAQVAIVLNATPAKQLRDVVMENEVMPAKSTYFYPKLITGMLLNPLR